MKRYAGFNWFIPLLARRFKKVTGLEHLPRTGPYILAGNHVGSLDPIFIMSIIFRATRRPVVFIAHDIVVQAFGERLAFNWLGMVKKIEAHPSEALSTLRKELDTDKPVGIFPEGMRNAAPFLLPGKTGVARLAHWTGAPVVPFGFRGSFTWTVAQALQVLFSARRNLELHIGSPITFPVVTDELTTKELLATTTRKIMARIGELAGRPLPY